MLNLCFIERDDKVNYLSLIFKNFLCEKNLFIDKKLKNIQKDFYTENIIYMFIVYEL